VTSTKPSLALLREMSDEAVLRALMDSPRLTRAELAVLTGLSKPTVGDAVRRLEAAGLVRDTGERTTGRGGVGTYYSLAADVGLALAVSIAPQGVAVEVLNAAGGVTGRVVEPVRRPARPEAVTAALAQAARKALGGRRARLAVVSAADPVDKATGELVHLPDAPFLLGAMSPAATLTPLIDGPLIDGPLIDGPLIDGPLIDGPVVVDNDVNWAARAELAARTGADRPDAADDFVYLYLGEGLGCAVVADGQVRRGHHGLAGEIAHVQVPGPGGQAMPLIEVFARLGLRHAGSTAIDVGRLLAALEGSGGAVLARVLAEAVSGVLDAAVAFADPAFAVVGGPWGSAAPFAAGLAAALPARPRGVRIARPKVHDDPSLAGARAAAVHRLRADLVARSR
jgi:predicted NBD/HSP70 family sugar kinase